MGLTAAEARRIGVPESAIADLGLYRKQKAKARAKAERPFRSCGHPAPCGERHGCLMNQAWVLSVPAKPPGTNEAYGGTVREKIHLKAEWNGYGASLVFEHNLPTVHQFGVAARCIYRQGKRVDVGGLTFVVKALIDGMVTAGLAANDSQRQARFEGYCAVEHDRKLPCDHLVELKLRANPVVDLWDVV